MQSGTVTKRDGRIENIDLEKIRVVRRTLERSSGQKYFILFKDTKCGYFPSSIVPHPFRGSAPEVEKLWLERMADKGWTAPEWPTEYGGGGLSRDEAKILDQEMRSLEVPPAVIGFGLEMIGPVLLRYGTEDQKQRHLTKICRGEIRWCQGYSEPGAGSDLASVQMKGVLDGDTYTVNGQKIWTSYADLSDWIFCLVRTEPDKNKHEGISFILIDMDQPGVSVKPILLIRWLFGH